MEGGEALRRATAPERSRDLPDALGRLDVLAKHLRVECPWDREQDALSIVPHTVEEAYELADAARQGDDAKLLDELGDVLYQVYFLALILEERDAGDLAAVADNMREKLIRRHPHVFGDRKAADAAEAIKSWGEVKRRRERGGAVFGEIPETLPGTLYAQKILSRAAGAGREEDRFATVGRLLLAAVDTARELGVDPELALRAAADEYKREIEEAESR